MSEAHGEPPADVRSFLPRPGEPVEEYAQRLRALHRDLTLVLQAVERGLASAGERPPPVQEPPRVAPREEPPPARPGTVEVRPLPGGGAHAPSSPAHEGALQGTARVEVVSAPTGEHRRDDVEDRRRPTPAEPPWPDAPAPEDLSEPAPAGARAGDVTLAPQRLPPRPSAVAPPEAEPAWVHRDPAGGAFTAASFGPPGSRSTAAASPVVIVALVLGWLTVLALALALLLGG